MYIFYEAITILGFHTAPQMVLNFNYLSLNLSLVILFLTPPHLILTFQYPLYPFTTIYPISLSSQNLSNSLAPFSISNLCSFWTVVW